MPMSAFTYSEEILDSVEVPIFVLDVLPGEIFQFRKLNSSHEKLSGLKNEEVFGKSPHDFLPERTANTITKNYLSCLRRNAAYTYEENIDLATGPKWWQTTLSPIRAGNVITGIIGIATDITEFKETQFKQAESNSKIKALNDDLALFTSTAAHDLRGPLRQIGLMVEMIGEGFEDLGDGKKELLEKAGDMTKKALSQIDDMLSYARSLTLDLAPHQIVDVHHVCSDLVAILDPLSTKTVALPSCLATTDKAALQIALRNLLDNAIKFANSQVAVTVTSRADRDGEWIVVTVSDDGEGFQSSNEPIGGSQHTDSQGGVHGFGLAAVQQLAEARGGTVWVDEPELGDGATIRFTIPGRLVGSD
ncbi:MAG: hypothetical protein MnENMB40S_14420 [Rhizobiaceae bacterium MnEN-MB40S]|nr:MAG: hypothetical protein MnENMB40S_14420 [Rhizobiaceae bacterium MnEN-MB40S]